MTDPKELEQETTSGGNDDQILSTVEDIEEKIDELDKHQLKTNIKSLNNDEKIIDYVKRTNRNMAICGGAVLGTMIGGNIIDKVWLKNSTPTTSQEQKEVKIIVENGCSTCNVNNTQRDSTGVVHTPDFYIGHNPDVQSISDMVKGAVHSAIQGLDSKLNVLDDKIDGAYRNAERAAMAVAREKAINDARFDDLEDRVFSNEQEISKIEDRIESLEGKVAEQGITLEEVSKFKQDLQQAEVRLENLITTKVNEAQKEQNTKMVNKLTEFNDSIEKLKTELEKYNTDVWTPFKTDASQRLQELENRSDRRNQEINDLRINVEDYAKEVTNNTEKVNELTNIIAEKSERITVLIHSNKRWMSQIKGQLEAKLKLFDGEIDNLAGDVESMEQKVANFENKLLNVIQENLQLTNTAITNLQKFLSESNTFNSTQFKKLEQLLITYNDSVNRTKNDLSEIDSFIKKIRPYFEGKAAFQFLLQPTE